MRMVVAGSGGMLGGEVAACARRYGVEVIGVNRGDLDVSQPGKLMNHLESLAPGIIVNCAADTDVEGAESAIDRAYAVNALLPERLASFCRRNDALLIQISSTGCYGDWKDEAYTDYDPLRPTTIHHKAKAAGEEAVRFSGCEHLILRTGWLYGGGVGNKKNFVWRRLQEGFSQTHMFSDPSQKGVPTFIGDVAEQIMALIESGLTGTYNCVAHGSASRFEYVSRILQTAGAKCAVEAGSKDMFKRKAPVSPNETAVNLRLSLLGADRMRDWKTALDAYVGEILKDMPAEERA